MKVLVCGGAGYVGSHCVNVLVKKGVDVVVLDNLSTGHKQAINKNAKFYEGDIRDYKMLDEVFQKETIDCVIHFCAKSLVGESTVKPLEYFDNNVSGTIVLLQAMQKANVDKIVFSSSAAVYGEHKIMPITEEYTKIPTNPYGQTKLMMEEIMNWCSKAYGLKYVSLRYFNVAGASYEDNLGEDHNPETHLIPNVIFTALDKLECIKIFGTDYDTFDKTCVRDYIHVLDLIDAHVLAMNYLLEGNDSNIFNLGSQTGYSVNEIITTVEKVSNKILNKKYEPRRAGDPAKLIASGQKAKEILGFSPKYNIEDIIYSAYMFHKNNINGFN